MYAIQSLVRGLDELIFPPQCLACDSTMQSLVGAESICSLCTTQLFTDLHETCPRCASTVGPHVDTSDGCPKCRSMSFAFDSAMRLGPYANALQAVVLKMKHLEGESLSETMGRIWSKKAEAKFRALNAQIVIPIPLHWRRKCERGYNQSEAVAFGIASKLELPCRINWLKRTRYTPIKPDRSRTERLEIVKGAFRVTRFAKLQTMRVLLIDDVLTTGATMNEAAKVLKAAGVAQVTSAVLAHR